MAADLVGTLLRETCPSCMRAGGECRRCNGSGYVFKEPYALTSGELAVSAEELELERLRGQVRRLASPICCPNCGTEVERRAS